MSSNRCLPDSRPGHSVRERRAHIACTRCRHLKKKCRQGAGADCQRCDATGQECQYLRVVDEMANNSPPPAAEPIILEPANIASPSQDDETYIMQQLQSLYLDNFGASNTNPQPPTPETSYFSNDIQDTPSYYYTSNIELFIPNAQAGPSDPRSASGASITYNQLEHIDAKSYILRCSVCSAGYRCVAHTPGSNYL